MNSSRGAVITMTASDTANGTTTSFNGNLNHWSDSLAPSPGNTYTNSAFLLRSPNAGLSHAFAGDSLTLSRSASAIGRFLLKGPDGDTVTVNNLILNGGLLDLGVGTDTFTTHLAGSINVQSTNTSYLNAEGSTTPGAGGEILNITATIQGSGGLQIGGIGGLATIEGLTVPTAAASNSAGTVKLSADNSFSGAMTVAGAPVNTSRGGLQLAHLNAIRNATLILSTTNSSTVNPVSFLNSANTGTFMVGALSGTADLALSDTTGNAVLLDVGGNHASTTFAGALTGSGGLLKSGSGTLTLSGTNAYAGNTTISGGTLVLGSASLSNSATVSIATGAMVQLDYSGTDTIGALYLNGVRQPDGIYGADNVPAYIAGPGKLQVGALMSPYRITRTWEPFDGTTASTPPSGYFEAPFMPISETPSAGSLRLAGNGGAAPIHYSAGDAAVVGIAANALRDDIQRVTQFVPAVSTAAPSTSTAILIGTIGKSPLIDGLVAAGKIDVSTIQGKWEAYTAAVVDNPMQGVTKALVIAGSDRRGTAYGVFGLSESIGVSPWYWWADVPTVQRSALYVSGTHTQRPPGVKYRGIFINDEDWGFQPWAAKTFEPEIGNVGPKTYATVFELLLRLHANVIWPAMHESPVQTTPFYLNEQNKVVADKYAIVISTSHHEPMLRNSHEYDEVVLGPYNYWTNRSNIYDFWEKRVAETAAYENIYTIGMRGRTDAGMLAPAGTTNQQKAAKIQNEIIPDQRRMISDHVNTNPSEIPQIFIPYKETLVQYQSGLQLPDDVTILWPDDNHGYIRQLSNVTERARSGGSGVYYHLSYWGVPRNYLWLCTTPPGMTCLEMMKAWDFDAQTMWLVNVGDIKPHEIGMEFFLRLARNPEAFRNFDQHAYFVQWATRNFGAAQAEAIATVLDEYFRLNIVKRPEHVDKTTSGFSFVNNGDEAQRRLDAFTALAASAEAIYAQLSGGQKAAFYEMVLYPVRGSNLVNQKVLRAERSRLWAAQGRAATSTMAASALAAQTAIQSETTFYNQTNANGKWNGMMTWTTNSAASSPYTMPTVGSYTAPSAAGLGVVPEGTATTLDAAVAGELPVFHRHADPKYFVDVFNTGTGVMAWTAQASNAWITLSQVAGTTDARLWVGIDWTKMPRGAAIPGTITIQGAGTTRTVNIKASYPLWLDLSTLSSAVENNGEVVIEAEDFIAARDSGTGVGWRRQKKAAATGDAMTIMPVTAPSVDPSAISDDTPSLSYEFYAFKAGTATIKVSCLPTHKITSEHLGCRYAISLNGATPQIVDNYAIEYSSAWNVNTLRASAEGESSHTLTFPGKQTVKIWMVDAGVVLDRLKIDINSGVFEAENMSVTASGDYHTFEESIASGEGAISLDATAVGDSIIFALPNLTPGSYDLTVRAKKGPSRGISQMAIGDSISGPFTNLGSAEDLYASSLAYADLTTVRLTVASAGTKYLKFTVTGKNASSSNYWIVPDKFTFATVSASTTAVENWRSIYFGSAENSGDSADSADPDQDGIRNLVEYATGSYPTMPNAAPCRADVTGNHLTLTFSRAKEASDITYHVMANGDLTGSATEIWSSDGVPYPSSAASVPVTVADPQSTSQSPSRFLWLRVSRP